MPDDIDPQRKSGLTQSQEVAQEVFATADDAVEPLTADVPSLSNAETPEIPTFRRGNTGMSRMRVGISSEDRAYLAEVHDQVDDIVVHVFRDAYAIMSQIYDVVRTPVVDDDGEPVTDRHGFVQWVSDGYGDYEADWTRLGIHQREHFIFELSTRLFDWEQRAVGLWGDAMLFKAQHEERFADAYLVPGAKDVTGKTESARTNFAKREVAEDRYLAIMQTVVSRRADAVVRTMTLLCQRLKDTVV